MCTWPPQTLQVDEIFPRPRGRADQEDKPEDESGQLAIEDADDCSYIPLFAIEDAAELAKDDLELTLVNTLHQKGDLFTKAVAGPLWGNAMKLIALIDEYEIIKTSSAEDCWN